jgi:hypothetical protein
VLGILVGVVPPIVAILGCGILAQPVAQRVRGVEWTQRDVARQSGGVLAVLFVPLLLVVAGLETLTENPRAAVLCFVAALLRRSQKMDESTGLECDSMIICQPWKRSKPNSKVCAL